MNEQDLLLPRAVTQRLAKSVLPPDTAIQKDALLAIQKAATVFISYLSSQYILQPYSGSPYRSTNRNITVQMKPPSNVPLPPRTS